MKVSIEVQHSCAPLTRGIPIYIVNLVQKLLERKQYDYQLTLFDKNKEMGNRLFADKYFGGYNCPIFECNTESYKTLLYEEDAFERKSYNDYTLTDADVYHFPHLMTIPDRLRGKMVVTCHDIIPAVSSQLWKSWESPAMKMQWELSMKRLRSEKPVVIADSLATKSDICNYTPIPPERVFVVLLAHDNGKLYPYINKRTLETLGIDGPYLLYVGTVWDSRKGVIDILTAFEKIAHRYKGLKLVLAGGYEKNKNPELDDKLLKTGVKDRIIIAGLVTDEQKRALLSSALVFLFPSEYEGFGLPVLEAMACGAPVITTNVSSLPEVGGGAVVYVSPNSPEQLAHETEQLIDSQGLRDGYIKKGLERSKKFSWDKTAQMTEEVYRYAYEQ